MKRSGVWDCRLALHRLPRRGQDAEDLQRPLLGASDSNRNPEPPTEEFDTSTSVTKV